MKNHLENVGVDERLILQRSLRIRCEVVYWIELDRYGIQWRVLVETAMNFWVP
jgi:hypothetical protein